MANPKRCWGWSFARGLNHPAACPSLSFGAAAGAGLSARLCGSHSNSPPEEDIGEARAHTIGAGPALSPSTEAIAVSGCRQSPPCSGGRASPAFATGLPIIAATAASSGAARPAAARSSPSWSSEASGRQSERSGPTPDSPAERTGFELAVPLRWTALRSEVVEEAFRSARNDERGGFLSTLSWVEENQSDRRRDDRPRLPDSAPVETFRRPSCWRLPNGLLLGPDRRPGAVTLPRSCPRARHTSRFHAANGNRPGSR
jgi:hypothetical protein